MRGIAVLGATGSIGTQTLDAVRTCLPHFRVKALTGYANVDLLAQLVKEFSPEIVWVPEEKIEPLRVLLANFSCEIVTGEEGLHTCATLEGVDIVVNALVGRAGLAPTLAAIHAGKHVALANKESLVTAGGLIMPLAREKGVRITPIDSEHSAIWQCLAGNENNAVEKIILTASGGPFRTWERSQISVATASHALKHPNWNMGAKITIDSATLMNKGLEYIEALWLFDLSPAQIEIVVHPQSIVHSMVQFADGSIMAQLGLPDMRLPILYALTAPARVFNTFPRLNLLAHPTLTFEPPDQERFPCLALAKRAFEMGGTAPAVLNYANELAVARFLRGAISFYDISAIIGQALDAYTVKPLSCAEDIWEAEAWVYERLKD
ncbi:MAG: 1-deoxy-D-xylulose-5-phosphate reductoisomerase [Defluviitaleaceae bacterium]|nr:1-deoxy-D-xylulose-5-phosphate reductoisomerase [Defluviitaleaceae bacterium]MCL2274350.1 1-deoxy-D-xylulose-5-phosphate reductoisomerase [Defluviitaleaceae bacterium]